MGFLDSYEPVEDRLREFWKDHPNGRIKTKLIRAADGDYLFRAAVWTEDKQLHPRATGFAHDSTAQLPANMKASALEVCETSAIGRALANLGYAPKGKRPSREEMSKSSGAGAGGSRPAPDPKSSSAPVSNRDERGNQGGRGSSAADEVGATGGGPDGSSHASGAATHDHEWIPSPTLTKFDVCSTCGETKRKGARL